MRATDARSRRATPAAVLAAALVLLTLPPLGAQQPRPWLDWRTVETPHFVFHYPTLYREWTLALAAHVEQIRDRVQRIVGFAPPERVHVVVDDPLNDANGYAFTTLDAPTVVLWATPPTPREEIGNFEAWNELVATHEFAHIAHLTRPSRNRVQRLLRALSPVPLGPIPTRAPRWALEGYATYVEGRATGSGRPNHAWRAAILRQYALEGRLPGYGALNATGEWQTGAFAYLAGSAFLEWLARREGDSSVTALWRRLTAVTNRSFDAAFAGVYGGSPAELYGRFSAQLTADAVALERILHAGDGADGLLVQRLLRNTGDPAVSPDGAYVALTIRRVDAPSELVVWRTAAEPDTASARRRELERRRDPEDVPDRPLTPPPRKPVITLVAPSGAPYEGPRWMPDNRHLLVWRRVPRADGALRPDLFLWNAEDGTLARVTNGASVRDADPAPDGRWAAATRCEHGWCDLVRVDLASGAVRILVAGSPVRNFYRPRISPRTGEIAVAEQRGDRWRIALLSPDGTSLRYADPNDGATRYDAAFAGDGRTLVVTSESSGIANLERLAPSGPPTRLTSVTGAAVAADVAPDGSVWFLNLRAAGFDLRRLPPRATLASAESLAVIATLPPADSAALRRGLIDPSGAILPPAPLSRPPGDSLPRQEGPVGPEHPYGVGPTRLRYLPTLNSGDGGSTAQIALVRSDPAGRLSAQLIGSVGSSALPEGVALSVTSRLTRTFVSARGWLSHEAPSREYQPALARGLDLSRAGGALRLDRVHVGDFATRAGSLSALAEYQQPSSLGSAVRLAGIATFTLTSLQRDETTTYSEVLAALGELGRTAEGAYARQRALVTIGAANRRQSPATLRLEYGTVGSGGGSQREAFVLGGFASPLVDPLFDARRVEIPVYPVGTLAASSFSGYRLAAPLDGVELYYSGYSPDMFQRVLRSYGIELRERIAAVSALGTPGLHILAGLGRAVDEPLKGSWRYYVSVRLD